MLNKEIYGKLRGKSTPSGFTVDDIIQTGVDNPGKKEKVISIPQSYSNLFGSGLNVWHVFCSTKLIVMSRNSLLHLRVRVTLHSRQQEDFYVALASNVTNLVICPLVPKATPSS